VRGAGRALSREPERSHANRVEYVSGDGFAWGVKQQYHTSSSCDI
jgi:hypothetical protein